MATETQRAAWRRQKDNQRFRRSLQSIMRRHALKRAAWRVQKARRRALLSLL